MIRTLVRDGFKVSNFMFCVPLKMEPILSSSQYQILMKKCFIVCNCIPPDKLVNKCNRNGVYSTKLLPF